MSKPVNYPLTFRAAILERNHAPLALDEVTFEGPLEAGQVLVKILYSGICGKQLEEISASRGPDPYLPHMLGHEGSGIVVDTGPGVKKVRPGDAVVLHWMKGSGIDAATPAYVRDGERVNAGWITTFNEYGVVSENRLTPISSKADMATACLLGCAATTGIGVIVNEARVRPNQSVAVFGCGGVGLSAVQGASMIGAFPIIAVDIDARSLALATRFGATHTLDPNAVNVQEEIARITEGRGAEQVIVSVGVPKVIESAVSTSSVPGSVYLVAVPPADATIEVNAFDIHCKRSLMGSCGGGIDPDRDIPGYLDLDSRGEIRLRDLITKNVTLDNINEGIDTLKSGMVGRCTVRMHDDVE